MTDQKKRPSFRRGSLYTAILLGLARQSKPLNIRCAGTGCPHAKCLRRSANGPDFPAYQEWLIRGGCRIYQPQPDPVHGNQLIEVG